MKNKRELIRTFDTVAEDYARDFRDELRHKPFDRELLARWSAALPTDTQVCDLGCGPGHVASHLEDSGVRAFGTDISAGMMVGRQGVVSENVLRCR